MDIIGSILSGIFTFLLMMVFSILTLIVVGYTTRKVFIRQRYKKEIEKKQNIVEHIVLQIKMPHANQRQEDAMENFFRSLHRLLPSKSLMSLEMVSTEQFLHFYVVISPSHKNIVESQLYAEFPDAEIEQVKDIFANIKVGESSFVEIGFKHSSIRSIKTYQELEEDLLKNLSAVLSKTEPGEKVFVQLVLKKVGHKFLRRGVGPELRKMFAKSSTSSSKLAREDLFMGKLRVGYIAKNKELAREKLATIVSLLKVTKGGENELKAKRSTNLLNACITRVFEYGDFWSIPEIVTLYHFPYKGGLVSNVVQSDSKRAPAPDILPRADLVDPKDISVFGETDYRNEHRKFGIKRIDRRRHLYVVGKTGSGKSRLLQLLLISDILNGEGCCLIDPHGDLSDELLKYVPKDRIKDVVYVNPTDADFPIGFNPLEPVSDYQMRQHLSTFFIAIFKKLLAVNWNARMEHLMRYITLALLETPDSSVLGIQRILSDTTYRQRVIKQIQDPVVKSFWLNDFSSSNQQFLNEAVIPILNKVGQFTSNPIIRNMIGQRKNMLDFAKFMDTGKIVLINLSKGKLGEENAALLGSMFITKIQQAALARAKIPEEERRDFYFYVDEFQNFATDAFSSILSEARKYHLDLTIAHQYIAQLPNDVKATAFGNVGSIIAFAVGADDAAYLAKEFAPVFSPDDMINLNAREMYVKMSIDGKLAPPFSARTINTPQAAQDFSKEIVDKSRMTYGKNRIVVENEIRGWNESINPVQNNESDGETFPEPII